MFLCSGPQVGTELRSFLGGAGVRDARSYGSFGDECPQKPRYGQARAAESCAQVEHVAHLSFIRAGMRGICSLSSQVVAACRRRSIKHQLVASLVGALTLIALCRAVPAADVIADVTLRSGVQLKDRLAKVDRNTVVAQQYFDDLKLRLDFNGLTEITFRVVDAKGYYSLFFMPFTEPTPKEGQQHLVLEAEGPKGTRTFLGTISATAKEAPEVTDEKIVVGGKVEPGHGQLKTFLKCSVAGCVPAGLGCLTGGPSGSNLTLGALV